MNVASVAVPSVSHAPISTVGLTDKISIKSLNFYYGDAKALKNISMSLYQGKVTAYIGPSGCGKSTLLRVLNRMYDLYPHQRADGEVLFDGQDILSPKQDLNLLRARIGMVFQKPTPFPMSIYDNIAFGIRLYERLPKSELDDRVESSPKRAALWDEVKGKLNQSGLGLSGGQQQRLCIARTIAVRPEVILLDEPTSALDPVGRRTVRLLLEELRGRGVSVLLNSHLLSEIELVCDRVVILLGGEVVTAGTPAELASPRGVELETDRGTQLVAGARRDDVPRLVADAVRDGRSIYGVRVLTSTLEDTYLEAVGGETD